MIKENLSNKNLSNKDSSNTRTKTAILLLNDLLREDFEPIIDNIEFKENLVVITNVRIDKKKYGINLIFDRLDDTKNLLQKLRVLQSKDNLDFCGIIGLDEEYNYAISEAIAKEFGLKCNSRKTLDTISNKYLQIEALKDGGVDVPQFKYVDDYEGSKDFRMPCVIKPVKGISSLHVYKINDSDELKTIFRRLDSYKSETFLSLTNQSNSTQSSRTISTNKNKRLNTNKRFILEEFIDGNEYSCDFLVGKDILLLRVVKKITSKQYFPFFEGLYLFNPDESKTSEFSSGYLKDVCKRIAKSLNITTGLCMVDFRFDAKRNKIIVIETTTRPGVDDFTLLMKKNYDYISMSIALRNIFGTLDVNSFQKIPEGNSVLIYLTAPKSGILKRFDTTKLEKLKLDGLNSSGGIARHNILKLVKYNKAGDKIDYLGLLKNPPYIGHIIIDDIRAEDIDGTIEKIKSNIDVKME